MPVQCGVTVDAAIVAKSKEPGQLRVNALSTFAMTKLLCDLVAGTSRRTSAITKRLCVRSLGDMCNRSLVLMTLRPQVLSVTFAGVALSLQSNGTLQGLSGLLIQKGGVLLRDTWVKFMNQDCWG